MPLLWPRTVCSRRFLYHPRLENNSVTVPIIGSSDSAAKKEDRKEDGAPPVAEEQA